MSQEGPVVIKEKEHQEEEHTKLWTRLTAIPETPGALRRTLSAKNVQSFMKIMTSPKMVEFDWFYLCGSMTKVQAAQYQKASGDYDSSIYELTNLAVEIAHDIKSKLPQLIDNEIRGQKKEGVFNLFKSLIDLNHARFKNIEDLNLGCRQLGDRFLMQTIALIGADLIEMHEKNNVSPQGKEVIKVLVEQYRKMFLHATGAGFPGTQLYSEKSIDEQTIAKEDNVKNLDGAIGFSGECSDEEFLKMTIDNEEMLMFVKKEALYKKIPQITLHEENPQIILIKDDDETGLEYGSLCAVRINFRKNEKIGFPKFTEGSKGFTHCDYGNESDILNCNIDPETGDLCFISSGTAMQNIFSENRYVALQNFILRKSKEYLESKEPDVEDFFAYSRDELTQRIYAVDAVSTQSGATDDVLEATGETTDVDTQSFTQEPWEHVPYQETSRADTPTVREESMYLLPKHFRTQVMDRIHGARAEETISALRRMFGKEERVEGSHHFFKSKRTGVVLPVPKHSRKDKHHISLQLILSNLKSWGYNPLEFAMELGLRIPNRVTKAEMQ